MTGGQGCGLEWCEVTFHDDEHWSMIYTPATHSASRHLTVGFGVKWPDGEEPAIVVHIDGNLSDLDVDEDAHLRLQEAIELRSLLDRAIGIAESVGLGTKAAQLVEAAELIGTRSPQSASE